MWVKSFNLYIIYFLSEKTFIQILKKLLWPMYKDPKMFLRAMIHPLTEASIVLLFVEFTRRIVDALQWQNYALIEKYMWWCVILLCVWIIERLLTKKYGYIELWPKLMYRLTSDYLRRFIVLDNNQVERLWTWRILTIVDKGIYSWIEILTRITVQFTRQALKMVFSLVLVFSIDIWYGFALLVAIWFIIVMYVFSQNRANMWRRKRKILHIQYMRELVRVIMSKFEVLQHGHVEKDLRKHAYIFGRWYRYNRHIENMHVLWESVSVFVVDGLKILSIVIVLYGFLIQDMSVWSFVAIMTVLGILDQITWNLSRFYIDATKEYIHVEKLRHTFASIPTMMWFLEWSSFIYRQWDISLRNISFMYDDVRVFHDFSLSLQGGKKIAFVGMSGAGKSTLVKLIAWYLRPTGGDVYIDGQALWDIALQTYYKHVGYLTQEPMIFDGSILENMVYGITDSFDQEGESISHGLLDIWWDDEDVLSLTQQRMDEHDPLLQNIHRALRLAQCAFVFDFPQWLHTQIGERWINLSGGQRQRLAIAKIFLKDPKIIILDEPTAALDSFSEQAISEAMHTLFTWRTVLIIAHRLQTVKEADEIILLGKTENDEISVILERGTHHELIAAWGMYADMLALQSGF